MRRVGAALVVLALACLGGCTALSRSSVETLRLAFQGPQLVIDESSLNPAAGYLRVQTRDSELLMGRGFVDQGLETWYGDGDELLTLRDGVLVNSLGMSANLAAVRWLDANPLAAASLPALPVNYRRHIDRLPEHYNEITEYRLQDCGARRIKAWGRVHDVRCLQESVVTSNAREPMPGNTYWLAGDGTLVQSRQWLAPGHELILQPRLPLPAVTAASEQAPPMTVTTDHHLLVVVAPTRLNQLLREHPLPQAWLPGSAWLARSEELPQHQLKRGVLYDIDRALQGDDLRADSRARLQALRERLVAMAVTGRKPLPPLNARWLQGNPRRDPVLNGGDRLVRPLRAGEHVLVVGDVPQACRLAVTPDLSVREAVARCSDRRLLPDSVFRIDADGRVTRVDIALWNREPDRGVAPGSRILVPFRGFASASGNAAADADLARWLASQFDPSAGAADAPAAAAGEGTP